MTDALVEKAKELLAKRKAEGKLPTIAAPKHAPEKVQRQFTDLGNSDRLVDRYAGTLRWVPELGWLVWDGCRWKIDTANQIVEHAKDTVEAILVEALGEGDDDKKKRLIKWALASQERGRISSMIDLARSDRLIATAHDKLDHDPYLLNCPNVTVDLRTGAMREHRRDDAITKVTSVDYDPTATCPKWEAFLAKIFPGKPYLPFFLQQAVGYSLTGNTKEQCIFIPYGTGQNGKSTFLDVVARIMGDYSNSVPVDTILVSKRDAGIPNDIAMLRGSRMVLTGEVEQGKRLAESLVKQMTGGEKLVARFLHKEFFTFHPQFKLWFGTNHKPVVRGADDGIWRRIHLIPFAYRIPDNERVQDFQRSLDDELPGILNWMVKGAVEWHETGLIVPEEVRNATRGYRSEMDILGNFLDECCTLADDIEIQSSELYREYAAWCERNGEYCASNKALSAALKDRGFEHRKGKMANYWMGISVATHTATNLYE